MTGRHSRAHLAPRRAHNLKPLLALRSPNICNPQITCSNGLPADRWMRRPASGEGLRWQSVRSTFKLQRSQISHRSWGAFGPSERFRVRVSTVHSTKPHSACGDPKTQRLLPGQKGLGQSNRTSSQPVRSRPACTVTPLQTAAIPVAGQLRPTPSAEACAAALARLMMGMNLL